LSDCKKSGCSKDNVRQYSNLSKIEFIHHELSEVIDPAFVKELHRKIAYKLFTQWLAERNLKKVADQELGKAV